MSHWSQWDNEALRARIEQPGQKRYPAGSPDSTEVALYRKLLIQTLHAQGDPSKKTILVLGMTPELRRLAVDLDCDLISVDHNRASIRLYENWLTPRQRARERIIQGDWLRLTEVLERPVNVIMGDGAFGNLLSLSDHRELLSNLRQRLVKDGALILRKILIPKNFRFSSHEATQLVHAFRAGRLNDAEFGFEMRLWGSFEQAYNSSTLLLDNAVVFQRYASWYKEGRLTDREHALVRRYYFPGDNLLPPQEVWEQLLAEAGFCFKTPSLTGRAWYAYYRLYDSILIS